MMVAGQLVCFVLMRLVRETLLIVSRHPGDRNPAIEEEVPSEERAPTWILGKWQLIGATWNPANSFDAVC